MKELGEDLESEDDEDDDDDDDDEEEDEDEESGASGEVEKKGNTPGDEVTGSADCNNDEKLIPNELDREKLNSDNVQDGDAQDLPGKQNETECVNDDDKGTQGDIASNDEIPIAGIADNFIENGTSKTANSDESPENKEDAAESEESPGYDIVHQKMWNADGESEIGQDIEDKTVEEGISSLKDEKNVESTQE